MMEKQQIYCDRELGMSKYKHVWRLCKAWALNMNDVLLCVFRVFNQSSQNNGCCVYAHQFKSKFSILLECIKGSVFCYF